MGGMKKGQNIDYVIFEQSLIQIGWMAISLSKLPIFKRLNDKVKPLSFPYPNDALLPLLRAS